MRNYESAFTEHLLYVRQGALNLAQTLLSWRGQTEDQDWCWHRQSAHTWQGTCQITDRWDWLEPQQRKPKGKQACCHCRKALTPDRGCSNTRGAPWACVQRPAICTKRHSCSKESRQRNNQKCAQSGLWGQAQTRTLHLPGNKREPDWLWSNQKGPLWSLGENQTPRKLCLPLSQLPSPRATLYEVTVCPVFISSQSLKLVTDCWAMNNVASVKGFWTQDNQVLIQKRKDSERFLAALACAASCSFSVCRLCSEHVHAHPAPVACEVRKRQWTLPDTPQPRSQSMRRSNLQGFYCACVCFCSYRCTQFKYTKHRLNFSFWDLVSNSTCGLQILHGAEDDLELLIHLPLTSKSAAAHARKARAPYTERHS